MADVGEIEDVSGEFGTDVGPEEPVTYPAGNGDDEWQPASADALRSMTSPPWLA